MNAHNRRHARRGAWRRRLRRGWISKNGQSTAWPLMSHLHLERIVNWCQRTIAGRSTFSSPCPTPDERVFARFALPFVERECTRRGNWTPDETRAWLLCGVEAKARAEYRAWLYEYREARAFLRGEGYYPDP